MSLRTQTTNFDPTLFLVLSLLKRLRPEEKVVVRAVLDEKEESKKEFLNRVKTIWDRTTKNKNAPKKADLEILVDKVRKDIYAQYSSKSRN